MHDKTHLCQSIHHLHDGEFVTITLPSPDQRLERTGLKWGDACILMTPAYWSSQSWIWEKEAPEHYRLGRTLTEELIACLLGGYGIPAEIGLAAYERLRRVGSDDPEVLKDAEKVEKLLTEPLCVRDRAVRYRFANQKSRYLALAMQQLPAIDDQADDIELRDNLCSLKGIGPKTASWIVRNWRGSDEVAILDIHILRTGRTLGLFGEDLSVEKHYSEIERLFLDFAKDIKAKASILDSVIWMTTRPNHGVRSSKSAPKIPKFPQLELALG